MDGWLCMTTTSAPFPSDPPSLRPSRYLRVCQTIYSKWPASWALQEAAAAKLAKHAKIVHAPRQATRSRFSRSATSHFPTTRGRRGWRGGASSSSNVKGAGLKLPNWQRKAAATELQAAFRGRRTRKRMQDGDERLNAPHDALEASSGRNATPQAVVIKPSRIPVPRSLERGQSNTAVAVQPGALFA